MKEAEAGFAPAVKEVIAKKISAIPKLAEVGDDLAKYNSDYLTKNQPTQRTHIEGILEYFGLNVVNMKE